MQGKILSIAGSDPSGGAGIQADIKTITALGGYAMAAVTALTVQDTHQIYDTLPTPAPFVEQQICTIVDDIGADVIKIGMLCNIEILKTVVKCLKQYTDIPVILDPIILSSSGHPLLDEAALDYMKEALFPLCHLITPNIPEAATLTGLPEAISLEKMHETGISLKRFKPHAILIKGGHLNLDDVCDLLLLEDKQSLFTSPRINTLHTHGTGCTLASAIATGIAQGLTLDKAVRRAHDYVHLALKNAPEYGGGHGPLNHLVFVD
jgi:hydroxymethylpyrimidine/phosphomethylpyrimidine kinase